MHRDVPKVTQSCQMSFLGEIQSFNLTDSQSHTLTCVCVCTAFCRMLQCKHLILLPSSPHFTVCSAPAVHAGVDLCFRGANRQLCDRTVCFTICSKKKKKKHFWFTYEVKLLKLKQELNVAEIWDLGTPRLWRTFVRGLASEYTACSSRCSVWFAKNDPPWSASVNYTHYAL